MNELCLLKDSKCHRTSPCAQDCYSVAIEMHNSFIKNVVSTERTLSKAISVAGTMIISQLCISVVQKTLVPRAEKGPIKELWLS